MDGTHFFDKLLRQITSARSRRSAVVGLLGGALRLLVLTETEAKRHKKKHKPKHPKHPVSPVSPPAEPQCPTSCPVCHECINGASCTVQSDFTPCGEDGCNVCQGGACVNRADGAQCGANGRCLDGVCDHCSNGVCEHCFDGIKNGSETDVDCGGSECLRCGQGKTCHGATDCESNYCDTTCKVCQAHEQCGSDSSGPCFCLTDAAGGIDCFSGHAGTSPTNGSCPGRQILVNLFGDDPSCAYRCGEVT
jgi:hypothetical protein